MRHLRGSIPIVIALLAAGCDSTTGVNVPAIVISANWRNAADSEHRIDFRSPDDGKTSGVVAGTEEGGECPGFSCRVGGFWANGQLEITIIRIPNQDQPKFRATFYENPTELVFQEVGGSETFTLVQN